MTNEEKAAVLLLSLDEETAAKVMKNFSSAQIQRIGLCMNRLRGISNKDVESTVREFCVIAQEKGHGIVAVNDEMIRNVITKAVGKEKAAELLKIIEEETFKPHNNPIIEKLNRVDPKILVDFTKTEHPQTIALILAHLRPEQAAEILENFPVEQQKEIVRRVATMKGVQYELVEEMARSLEAQLIVSSTGEQDFGGAHMMAEILNKMSRVNEENILETLDDTDPDLALEIRNLMFTFDDIMKLDDRSLRELLKEVDRDDLLRSLKASDPVFMEKIFKNMSKRAAEMLQEDLELLPPTRLSDVEKSQRVIIEIAKKLESEGRVTIIRGDEGNEYI